MFLLTTFTSTAFTSTSFTWRNEHTNQRRTHLQHRRMTSQRERERERGIITPNFPQLQSLFPYMLTTVTSVSPFRQTIFISASPNNTIGVSVPASYPGVPRFKSRPQDWLSSLLRDSFWYDQVNSGTAPQIMAGPNPCTYFHFIVWRYTTRVWDVCLDLDRLEREPEFFSRVITGDESWILEYDPETKR